MTQLASQSQAAWALKIAQSDGASLSPLRLSPSVEVAEKDNAIWIRSRSRDELVTRVLPAIPALARYDWLPGDRLRRFGSRIPSDSFPPMVWKPLVELVQVQLPPVTISTAKPGRVPLQLIRTAQEMNASLLLTDSGKWGAYARTAAEVRLSKWEFAINAHAQVLVRGEPLPPLPGRRYVLINNVAIPSGFTWSPQIDVQVLSQSLGLNSESIAIFHEDGTHWRLLSEQFVPATRAAVRASCREPAS
jgi:hypothetical protein